MRLALNPKINSMILPAVSLLTVLGIGLIGFGVFKSGNKLEIEFKNGRLTPQSTQNISEIFSQNLKKAISQNVAPEKIFENTKLNFKSDETLTALLSQNFLSEITKKNPAQIQDPSFIEALKDSSDPASFLGISDLNPAFADKSKEIMNSLIYNPPSFTTKNNASLKDKVNYFSALKNLILPFQKTNPLIIQAALQTKNYAELDRRIEKLKTSLLSFEKLEAPKEYIDLHKKIISFNGYQINVFEEIKKAGENNDPLKQYLIIISYDEILNNNYKTTILETINEAKKMISEIKKLK
ncbi:MAG: hypothetical protein HYV52_02020 [Parcubacteria group bacterium]|nr:hypothetical protein [Parcubacteria group bacterium]